MGTQEEVKDWVLIKIIYIHEMTLFWDAVYVITVFAILFMIAW